MDILDQFPDPPYNVPDDLTMGPGQLNPACCFMFTDSGNRHTSTERLNKQVTHALQCRREKILMDDWAGNTGQAEYTTDYRNLCTFEARSNLDLWKYLVLISAVLKPLWNMLLGETPRIKLRSTLHTLNAQLTWVRPTGTPTALYAVKYTTIKHWTQSML